jgi:hypothetical protein
VSQFEKHFEPRILMLDGMIIFDDCEKLWINLWSRISIKKLCWWTNLSFPDSIEIHNMFTPTNAEPSMKSTFRGISIEWSDEYANANDSIRANREFDSNESNKSDLHDEQRISTLDGIKIDWSDENENADDSIRVNRELDSNEMDESDWQWKKQNEQRISTLDGIIMDWSDEEKNAFDSIRVNRELDSNEIDESDLQHEKHSEQRISTLDGIIIDWSDEDENANDSIRFNREFDSNESDSHHEKHDEPRISISCEILTIDDCEKLQTSVW